MKHEVLQAIDKAIPSPILYILKYENQVRYVAAYKRQSGADRSKWVVSSYFETDWMSASIKSVSIPVVLDLTTLYYYILKSIISLTARQNETINELVSRSESLSIMERDAAKVEGRLEREKQFNRKVEINKILNELKVEIGELKNE